MPEDIDVVIHSQWDVPFLIHELRRQHWFQTEPDRIDRTLWIGSYDVIADYARESVTANEWREAEEVGAEHEIVDAYLEALAGVVSDTMGRELRREHVYAVVENGGVFLGQYDDVRPDDLREMGFEIGGRGATLGAVELIELGEARKKKRVRRSRAVKLARRVEREMVKHCGPEAMVLVGSLRRKRPEVADVEFVVLPAGAGRDDPGAVEEFAECLRGLRYSIGAKLRKATKTVRGIKVEIYVAHAAEEMGGLVFMYTGDYRFNIAMRRKAKRMGYRLNQYGIWDAEGNAVLQSPDEHDFFEFLGVDYHRPEERSVATRSAPERRRRPNTGRRRTSPTRKKRGRVAMKGVDPDIFSRMDAIWEVGA